MKSDYELSLRDYIAIIKDRGLILGVSIVVIPPRPLLSQ